MNFENQIINFLDEELEYQSNVEALALESTEIAAFTVKTEPMDDECCEGSVGEFAVPLVPRERCVFKCKICARMFKSRYAFTVHVNGHQKKCVNCKVVYKTWKDVEEHEKYCPKRFGCTVIHSRPKQKSEKPVKRPFKCQLCNRRYVKYEHLFDHQVQRCKKRYISNKWTVKI